MNKAFTKESDYDPTLEVSVRPRDVLPAGVKNYITVAGAERLRGELRRLTDGERPRLVDEMSALVAAGRQEEGVYRAAQRRLHELDVQMAWLTERIAGLTIVQPNDTGDEKVRFGATVTVLEPEGQERDYTIVGVDETDPEIGRISWISPLANALLAAESGDEVTVRLPRGDVVLEIVDVRYALGSGLPQA